MALQLKTAATGGILGDLLIRPPIPNEAVGYADFLTGLHMTQAAESVALDAALVFSPAYSVNTGYYYGRDEIEFMAYKIWQRVEYGPDGECLGLALDGGMTQRIIGAQRVDLTAAVATGVSVALQGAAAQPYQQWYAVTPTGGGEESITFTTDSIGAGGHAYFVIDVRGPGIVQVGMKNSDAGAYINADLSSGTVVLGANAAGQMIRRRDGWSLYVRAKVSVTGDAQPYIAAVATMSAGKLAGGGLTFSARTPRLTASTSMTLPGPGLWPNTTASKKAADDIKQIETLIADTADFTCVFRARSGWTTGRTSAGLFLFSNGGSSGTELRFTGSNVLCLVDKGSSTPRWTGVQRWKPQTIYRVGVSRTGGVVAVCVNGESATVDTGAVAADASPRLLRGFDPSINAWDGHLQKVIWWANGVSQARLRQMVDRWA